jgi:hypothetical protein
MKIRITMDIDPEYADDSHAMGVSEEGYEVVSDLLGQVGSNIDIAAEPS